MSMNTRRVLLALTHSVLQVLKKSKHEVPQEKPKAQADIKTDLGPYSTCQQLS